MRWPEEWDAPWIVAWRLLWFVPMMACAVGLVFFCALAHGRRVALELWREIT